MLEHLSGATRVHFIVGDPIAQVKSPFGMTQSFEALWADALCVPAQVSPQHLPAWLAAMGHMRNVDGIIVTVPHKMAMASLCQTHSPRAQFLGAVNTLRRTPDGGWHGDMFDGLGYAQALESQGLRLQGLRALLVGTGGAGSAIAHALVEQGVAELALHDTDTLRRDSLIARLAALGPSRVLAGSRDPAGFDLVINATPLGMREGDPLPIEVERLAPSTFVGCVITAPALSPLVAAARARGCRTVTGADMFGCVRELMLEFLVGPG